MEVWNGGPHDVYTARLAQAMEKGFQGSSAFVMSAGKKDGTLIATIPASVKWEKVGERIRITYSVVFSTVRGKELGAASGMCWDGSYDECARQIMTEAASAASRINAGE